MALVSCPECGNQVSDAAVSCPSCGHPIQGQVAVAPQPAAKPEKKELFEAGKSKFVLAEITAISCIKTRNWVWLVIGAPIMIGMIAGWLALEWPLALGITVAGMFVLAMFYVDEGTIASTGNLTKFDDDMEKVSARYHESLGTDNLIIYNNRNAFVDFQFSINPDRVAEFKRESSYNHIWLYIIGIAGIVAASELNIPALYVIGAVIALLGFLTRKAALQVTGVGGAKVNLYTKAGDIKKVTDELTQSLETREAA